MALFDFIKKQFIDILQWTEDGDGTLAWRFPMQDMEIQNGGTLVVRGPSTAVEPKVLDAIIARFKAAGLNEVMLKPFEPDLLCAKVEHWLLQRN